MKGLSTLESEPTDWFDFYTDPDNNIVVKAGKDVRSWLMNCSAELVRGKSYTPTMELQDAAAWSNWSSQHPELSAILMQLSPAWKAIDFQARMSIEANRFPNSTIPADKVIHVAHDICEKIPSIIDAITGIPGAAKDVSGVAADIYDSVKDVIQRILEVLKEMYEMWKEVIWPAIKQMWELMLDNWKPALEVLNNEVLQPFKEISQDGKVAFEQYRAMIEQQNRSVDATVPPIVMPNIDEYAKLMPILSKYFNLPIIGSIARAELQTMDMVDYQATQMRGFATPLKMLDYAAGMSAPAGLGQALTDLATKPPAWFLSNF